MINIENNYYVKVANELYDSYCITNEELTILILLYRNYMQYKSFSLCSIDLLIEYMKFDIHNNRKIVGKIKDIINSLIEKKYINSLCDLAYNNITVGDIKDRYFKFYVDLPPTPETEWFQICDNELNEIFLALKNTNLNKFNFIRYFIACRRVASNKSNFGYLTQLKLKQLINDSRTIKKYNEILQDDLHLIRYNNDYLTPERHYCTTFIGYWNDEENFNKQLQYAVESKNLVHTNKIKSNKKRSVKQRINKLENNNEDVEEKLKQLEEYKKIYGELNKFSIKEDKVINIKTHVIGKPKTMNSEYMHDLFGNDMPDDDVDDGLPF